MAIGGTGKFGLDSKVTSLFSQASDIFGKADAQTIFSSTTGQGVGAMDLTVKALDREINRLLGFKTDFTPGEQKRLDNLQAKIGKISEKAEAGTLNVSDLKERAELYQEAYRIMGKDYVDVEGNDEIQALTDKVDALLEPRLRGARKKRLEQLRKMEENYLNQRVERPDSETTSLRLRNVKQQISRLTPPRDISDLSPAERRDYDDLVARINALAEQEYLLPAKKRIRVEELQASKAQLQAQAAGGGGGGLFGQTSPSAAASAYTRLA